MLIINKSREHSAEFIKEFLPKIKKSDFTIQRPQTLFEFWDNLKLLRCIWCSNKLKKTLKGDYYCKGTKHKKSFYIKNEKLQLLSPSKE